jgi:hypothetical protein
MAQNGSRALYPNGLRIRDSQFALNVQRDIKNAVKDVVVKSLEESRHLIIYTSIPDPTHARDSIILLFGLSRAQ